MKTLLRALLALGTALSLGGCASGNSGMAAAEPVQTSAAPAADHAAWWAAFGSAELASVVERAQAQNLDVAAAGARVRQAEAQARIADATLWPSLSLLAGASREARWGNSQPVASSASAASFLASYQVDLWGGQRAQRDAAQAHWRASVFDADAVRLTVTAGTASAWLRMIGLAQRAAIAGLNLADAERLLELVEARHRAGAALPLELAQQRGIVATQRRQLAALRSEAAISRTSLATWLGAHEPLPASTARFDDLRVPSIEAGLPSDLLARRPDIARAEARLSAADADIAAARAAMLPSLSLDAGIATGSGRWRGLFDSPVYSLAAALAAPIFEGGRLSAQRDVALERREELLADYRSAIVAAFADAQIALQAIDGLAAGDAAQAEALRQARRALGIAESRYRLGAETLLTLLDAQRTLYAAQDAAAQMQLARLLASVDLYQALGGGWQAVNCAGPASPRGTTRWCEARGPAPAPRSP